MSQHAFDLKYLTQSTELERVAKILSEYKEADGYFPLVTPMQEMVVLVNMQSATVIKIVDLKPLRWLY